MILQKYHRVCHELHYLMIIITGPKKAAELKKFSFGSEIIL